MKKLVIALMAFALVITLAGCGGGGGGGGSSFILTKGDEGESLKNNGFTEVFENYQDIKTNLAQWNSIDDDKEGKQRANAIMNHVSLNYQGASTIDQAKNAVRAYTSVKDYYELKDRLEKLIKEKKFKGLTIYPCAISSMDSGKFVCEKTNLYVESITLDNNLVMTNQQYILNNIKWVKEGEEWKIISGFDELGKNRSELGK